MTTDRQKKAADLNFLQPFIESFEDFCVGLVELSSMRTLIAELLQSRPESGETILATIDTAFREGLIKANTYELLVTDIDRATSEDEPTEWSEQTRRQYEDKADNPDLLANDETGHPDERRGAAPPGKPSADIAPGLILKNRFKLISRIGGGSMADIYEAIDLRKQEAGSTNARLAIKIISSEFAGHAHAQEILQREALNGQGLNHPNIIRVFDFNQDEDRFYMTMELLEGQSLVEVLDARRFQPLPLDQAFSIIADIYHGLAYAHEQGIVHADIKPGNIFITTSGQAKLLDFGIARIARDNVNPDNASVAGAHTPAYSSCEVLEGAEPTRQDDIYAAACIAYRMLAGKRAFGRITALEAESRHIEPRPVETLTPGQWQALKKSLAFRRTDRPLTIKESAAKFLNPEPVHRPADKTEQITTPAPFESMPDGAPLRFGIPAIAALLIVIVLALFWPEPEPLSIADSGTGDTRATRQPADPDGPNVTTRLAETGEFGPLIVSALPPPTETVAEEDIETPSVPAVAEQVIESAEPEPDPLPDPEQIRIEELTALADSAMNDGRLLGPAGDNARLYIDELSELAPDAEEAQQRRTRLTELMLLEAMVATTEENFDTATRWIEETRSLGVSEETLERFEAELQKARDAQQVRKTESIGAIFASATPAAILADPAIDYDSEPETATTPEAMTAYPEAGAGPVAGPGSLSLMMMPGTLPDVMEETATGIPADDRTDSSNRDIALSALEFSHFVEPRIPRQYRHRNKRGWVELRFRVMPDGRTSDIEVTAAKPENRYEEAAIKAVSKWRFKPVYIDGIATEQYSSVKLRFEPD